MSIRIDSNRKTPEQWLALSCVIAAAFYFAHVAVGQAAYPGYDWRSSAVSDLTAADSPSFAAASALSNLYGTFACIGCLFVAIGCPE